MCSMYHIMCLPIALSSPFHIIKSLLKHCYYLSQAYSQTHCVRYLLSRGYRGSSWGNLLTEVDGQNEWHGWQRRSNLFGLTVKNYMLTMGTMDIIMTMFFPVSAEVMKDLFCFSHSSIQLLFWSIISPFF